MGTRCHPRQTLLAQKPTPRTPDQRVEVIPGIPYGRKRWKIALDWLGGGQFLKGF